MDRMIERDRVRTSPDEPVIPVALAVKIDDVVIFWVARVAVHQEPQGWVGVVDPDGVFKSPDHHAVAVGRYDCVGGLRVEGILEGGFGHRLLPVRRHARFRAIVRLKVGACGRSACGHTGVSPNRTTDMGVGAKAARLRLGTEPVVASCLVGVDDDVVTLADSKQEPFGREGVDGDEICRHDGHDMVVQRDADVRVDAAVDEAEAILFACGDSHLVGSSLPVGLPSSVDDDAAGGGGWNANLQGLLRKCVHLPCCDASVVFGEYVRAKIKIPV